MPQAYGLAGGIDAEHMVADKGYNSNTFADILKEDKSIQLPFPGRGTKPHWVTTNTCIDSGLWQRMRSWS